MRRALPLPLHALHRAAQLVATAPSHERQRIRYVMGFANVRTPHDLAARPLCRPHDPRQPSKGRRTLAETPIVAAAAILCGTDSGCATQPWSGSRLDWLRQYCPLEQGITAHDTYSAVLASIDAQAFPQCFAQ